MAPRTFPVTTPADAQRGIRGVANASVAKFWANVKPQNNGCWVWQGPYSPSGFGMVGSGMGRRTAHRVALELLEGRLDAQVGHVCGDKRCVNPDHILPLQQLDEPTPDGQPRTERMALAVSPGEKELIAMAAGEEEPSRYLRRTAIRAAKQHTKKKKGEGRGA